MKYINSFSSEIVLHVLERKKVIVEIIDTETSYVENLQSVHDVSFLKESIYLRSFLLVISCSFKKEKVY